MDECLTLDTEVLTLDGWKTIDIVNEGDIILQWDMETQKLSYEKIHTIKDVERYETFIYENDNFHQHVSGGHRMIIEKEGIISESTGKDLNVEDDFSFITSGIKEGNFVFDDIIKNKIKDAKENKGSLDWLYPYMVSISSEQANEILEYYSKI